LTRGLVGALDLSDGDLGHSDLNNEHSSGERAGTPASMRSGAVAVV
jgi:hypothetical protein